MTLKNEIAGRVVIMAVPFLWSRYRSKVYVVLGVAGGLLIVRQVIKRVQTGTEVERHTVRDRMVEPLASDQQALPTPTPQAFVDSDQRDEADTAVAAKENAD
jgi:hypothetical protein